MCIVPAAQVGAGDGPLPGRQPDWLDKECVSACAAAFADGITGLAESLPMTGAAGLCGDELLQSGGLIRTSYEAALKAELEDDFVGALQAVVEEVRECKAWLTLLALAGDAAEQVVLDRFQKEADRLATLVTAMLRDVSYDEGTAFERPGASFPRLRLSGSADILTSSSGWWGAQAPSRLTAPRSADWLRRSRRGSRSAGGILCFPSADKGGGDGGQ